MASLKEVQSKIVSVKKTKQITKAMNMVATSRLRGAQTSMEAFRPYAEKFAEVLGSIADKAGDQASPLLTPREEVRKVHIVLLTSDRGLCGGFNRDLFTFFEEHSAEFAHTTEILLFGEKMSKIFNNRRVAFNHQQDYPRINHLNFQFVSELFENHAFANKTCHILYNSYHGSGRYEPALRTIRWEHSAPAKALPADTNLIIDTDPRLLSAYLLRQSNLMEIYRIFLSSLASEHSFRFQLMENAITNTDNLIQELGLMVQMERQKKITSEMRELSISAGLLNR